MQPDKLILYRIVFDGGHTETVYATCCTIKVHPTGGFQSITFTGVEGRMPAFFDNTKIIAITQEYAR